jgi:uncharacterized protein (TIGR03437 family)
MNPKALLLIFMPVAAMAASTSLQFVPPSDISASGVMARGVVPLSAGRVAVYGAQTISPCEAGGSSLQGLEYCDQTEPPLLSILDASGNQTAGLAGSALGGGNSIIGSAAADSSGNIWITGKTDSDDFPLVHALFSQKISYQLNGFVAKLDPNLNILFSSFLVSKNPPTDPAALGFVSLAPYFPVIAVDSAGNAYIAGATDDPTFPVTGPAFGSPIGSGGIDAFVMKIASDGSKVLYSRLLGGSISPCTGGSACVNNEPFNAASAIAVDAAGNATVAGQTNTSDFPVTANVYNTGHGAFISRISADGSTLVWSTEVGAPPASPAGYGPTVPSSIQSVALDSAGDVYVIGSAQTAIVTTPNALQSTWQSANGVVTGGFVLKLSSDATQLLFATNLAGDAGSALAGVALDPSGNAWISGFTRSTDFPGLTGVPPGGLDFALELNADASALQQIFPLIPQTLSQPSAFDTNGNLLLLASAGNLLRLNTAAVRPAPAVFAITNSAIPQAAAGMAGGELLTLYGIGLGPSTGIVGAPDSNGRYPFTLGGVSIQLNGSLMNAPATLLYVGPNQINLELPLFGHTPTIMTISTPTGDLPPMAVNIAGSIGVFGVLNTDGSVNSPTNPAETGSIVSLYVTGLGVPPSPTHPLQDGFISPMAIPAYMGIVEVGSDFTTVPLPVLYAGTAPGEIDGLDQVNVQLPAGVPNPVLTVSVPGLYNSTFIAATSPGVTVFTK